MDVNAATPPKQVSAIDFGDVTLPSDCKHQAPQITGLYCSPIKLQEQEISCGVDGVLDTSNEDKYPQIGQIDFSTLHHPTAVIIDKNEDNKEINEQNKGKKGVKHRR